MWRPSTPGKRPPELRFANVVVFVLLLFLLLSLLLLSLPLFQLWLLLFVVFVVVDNFFSLENLTFEIPGDAGDVLQLFGLPTQIEKSTPGETRRVPSVRL